MYLYDSELLVHRFPVKSHHYLLQAVPLYQERFQSAPNAPNPYCEKLELLAHKQSLNLLYKNPFQRDILTDLDKIPVILDIIRAELRKMNVN